MELIVQGQHSFLYTGGKSLGASLPAIIFIHGAQQDHSCWNLQTRWFAHHGWAVIAPDLPAHGRSQGRPLASIEAMSDWIVALMDATGIQTAALVGHSMGSLIAMETGLRHSERISRLTLIGSSLPMPVSPALLDAAWHNEAKARAMVNAFSFSAAAQMGGNRVPGMWMMGVNQRLMARQQPGVFGPDMNACNAYARPIADLAAIQKPTLIIAGGQDRMTPAKASRAIAAAIPGAVLRVLPDAGHSLMAEQPDGVLDALREFLA